MSSEQRAASSRVSVSTYIPEYQKDEWSALANELDMNQSEFVRTMVQAGRRVFDSEWNQDNSSTQSADKLTDLEEIRIEERVLDFLTEHEYMAWSDLKDKLNSEVESRLSRVLKRLQSENRVRYDGQKDGYTLQDAQ